MIIIRLILKIPITIAILLMTLMFVPVFYCVWFTLLVYGSPRKRQSDISILKEMQRDAKKFLKTWFTTI